MCYVEGAAASRNRTRSLRNGTIQNLSALKDDWLPPFLRFCGVDSKSCIVCCDYVLVVEATTASPCRNSVENAAASLKGEGVAKKTAFITVRGLASASCVGRKHRFWLSCFQDSPSRRSQGDYRLQKRDESAGRRREAEGGDEERVHFCPFVFCASRVVPPGGRVESELHRRLRGEDQEGEDPL